MGAGIEVHAEIVPVIEHPPAWRTVMFPVTTGVHMLLGCLQAVESTGACVTFPHDGWNL